VTWLNAINDQVAGIGGVVVTGTMRDSLHVLDVILGRDGGPPPQMIATDTASYSDIVFGLFRLLGYQFSPRLADLPDQRLWRLTLPGAPRADYGAMNDVARNHLSFDEIRAQWPDMLRVAGSLHTGTVAGYDLLRMLGRDGNPSPLGAAFAEYGRAAKTLHLLAMCDPVDETYRRGYCTPKSFTTPAITPSNRSPIYSAYPAPPCTDILTKHQSANAPPLATRRRSPLNTTNAGCDLGSLGMPESASDPASAVNAGLRITNLRMKFPEYRECGISTCDTLRYQQSR
jgi:Tn3 transposase DDE domain